MSSADAHIAAIDATLGTSDAAAAAIDAQAASADAHVTAIDAHVAAIDAQIAAIDAHVAAIDAHVAAPDAHVAPAVCGNTIVETGEQCDDGNDSNFDGCRNDCTSAPPPMTIISVSSDDVQGERGSGSFHISVSSDGRYVAFDSLASTLVDNDVFVRDTFTGTTTRVSVDSDGVQGDSDSLWPAISADGRYVVFLSTADNLVAGDTNSFADIFVHDMVLGTTSVVSIDAAGDFGDGDSSLPAISADGRYIAFSSAADNLVNGDGNGANDVFVYDTSLATLTLVSVNTYGSQGDTDSDSIELSADGRYAVFDSTADNLSSQDLNGDNDVFLRDLVLGTTISLSTDQNGNHGNSPSFAPTISADGRFVAFCSGATNLVDGDNAGFEDVFVRDTHGGTITRISVAANGDEGNGQSCNPSISADGRYVAYASTASNLVANDGTTASTDTFVYDMFTGVTTRLSAGSLGADGNSSSSNATISPDGSAIAFRSSASNLVANDINEQSDVFLT